MSSALESAQEVTQEYVAYDDILPRRHEDGALCHGAIVARTCYSCPVYRFDHVVISALATASAICVLPIAYLSFELPVTVSTAVGTILGALVCANLGLFIAELLARRWSFFLKLARFGATGVFNTLLDTSILTSLAYITGAYAGLMLALCNAVSFSAAVFASYYINRSWSFRVEHASNLREFGGFVSVGLSSMLVNTAIVYAVTTHAAPYSVTPAVWLLIAKAAGVLVSFAWSFGWLNFYIFRTKHLPSLYADRNQSSTERQTNESHKRDFDANNSE